MSHSNQFARIIQPCKRSVLVKYRRVFEYRIGGGGFEFECDERGQVFAAKLPRAAAENLRKCLAHEFNVLDRGVQKFETIVRYPAKALCPCGRTILLDTYTNTCDCDADYDMSGHRLAPRSQWGEETGESLADILRIR